MIRSSPLFAIGIKAVGLAVIASLFSFMTLTPQQMMIASFAQLSGATGAFQQQQQEQQNATTQAISTPQAAGGEAATIIFVDVENNYSPVGFGVQVPEGWVLDVLDSTERSKTTIFGGNDFIRPASLCKEETSLPSIVGDKTYHCGEHGSSASQVVHVQSYSTDLIIDLEDPLLYHMDILDDNPSITNVRGISSIDTTVNYVDPQTNQTITTLPSKRADLVLTHPDGSQSIESILLTTVVTKVEEIDGVPVSRVGEHYVVRYQRPLVSVITTPQQQAEAMLLPQEIQLIFDSFQVLFKQEKRQTQTSTVVIDPVSSPSPDREVRVNPTRIQVGDTVRWENHDPDLDLHTVTSGINGQPDGKFDSGQIEYSMRNGAEPFEHTFTEAGEYPYFCYFTQTGWEWLL